MSIFDRFRKKHPDNEQGDGETRAEAKGVNFRVNFDDERIRVENEQTFQIFLNEIGLILDTVGLAAPQLTEMIQRENGDVQEIGVSEQDVQYIEEDVNEIINTPGFFELRNITGFVATVRNTDHDQDHNVSIAAHKKEHPGLWMRFRTADENNTHAFEINTWGGIIDSLGDFHSAERFGLQGTDIIDEVMDKKLTIAVNVLKKSEFNRYERAIGVRLELMTSNSRNLTVYIQVFNIRGERKRYRIALSDDDFNVNTVNSIKERVVDLAKLYNREYRNKGK